MIASQTYSPTFSPTSTFLNEALQVACASLMLAVCAQVSIPLPFTPVPLTGQTFGVMLIGALLGRRKGILSVLLYFMESLMGFPVLANGASGFLPFVGPTAGYLMGFLAQAYCIGWFLERNLNLSSGKILTIMLAAACIQMGFGMLWLSRFVGFDNVWMMGLVPFVPGGILKAIAATSCTKMCQRKYLL